MQKFIARLDSYNLRKSAILLPPGAAGAIVEHGYHDRRSLTERLDGYIAHKTGGIVDRVTPPPPAQPVPEPVIGSHAREALHLGRHVHPAGIGERIQYNGDQHVLMFGPNGKGKGTRFIMPNLLQVTGKRSFVVIDPKGENAAVTAPFRRSISNVVIINPFGVLLDFPGYEDLESVGYNPLAQLDPDARSFNSDVAALADALIQVDPSAPHWGISARALVAMMLMVATVSAKAAGNVPTMREVRELLCQPSGGDPDNAVPFYGIPAVAEEAMFSPIEGLRNKAAQFSRWNREVASIVSTAQSQTEPLDDMAIADDLCRTGFDFRLLKTEPTTVYVIIPPEHLDRHSKWLRLLITNAIMSSLRPRRPGECRVTFLLDEFYALGHLEIITSVWALVRGYGISIIPVLQSMIQLKELYPTMWENFIGMAGAVLSFGPNESVTSEWLARRSGETARTITTYSTSDSVSGGSGWNSGSGPGGVSNGNSGNDGWSKSASSNTSEVKAPVVTPWKLYGLPPGFLMMTLDGLSGTIPGYAPPYWDILECWQRARANPYFLGSN